MASLAETLVLHGYMTFEALSGVRSGGDEEALVRSLVDEGRIDAGSLARMRAAQAKVDFIEFADRQVDRSAVELVPSTLCRRHGILPLSQSPGRILIATADPGNVVAIDDVRAATRREVDLVVAERSDLQAALDRYLRADGELSNLTSTLAEESVELAERTLETDDADDDAPIVRFVNLLIGQAVQDHASDVHIEPTADAVRVRYRIDGVLHEMQDAPKSVQNGVISRLKIMSDIDIAERRRPQDGRMSVAHAGRQIDLRVATLPTVWGEKIVLRILDNTASSHSLADLAMLEQNAANYKAAYTKPYGMVLVTGPTGSGKSTTLYSTLQAVSRPEVNVITVEDPVEFRMRGINQMQVNAKAGLTFASALRSILRADPDVLLIGEIRDRETAQIAIEAALTGHLVFSTLHTNDAPSAITRLVEMGIEPFMVGTSLDCVVAQRLARRLCSRCARAVATSAAELEKLGFQSEGIVELMHPVGCQSCSNTGYRGRVALHEVMTVDEEIERLAVGRSSSAEIGRAARGAGMTSLRDDGWQKALLGITSIEEVLRVVA